MKRKASFAGIVNISILVFIAFTTVYPFYYLLVISFTPVANTVGRGLVLFPTSFDLSSYTYVFRAFGIGGAYRTTLSVVILGTILSLTLSTIGAYALSFADMPGRNLLMTLLIITLVFQAGLIPTYLVVRSVGLIDKLGALFIPNAINTFWLIIMRNFFQALPQSLGESARIDGSSEFRVLISIVLPISTPVIATIVLFYAVGYWNQYFNAIIYINSQDKRTLQVLIRSLYQAAMNVTQSPTDDVPPPVETIRSAAIIVSTLPILCAYPFLQKYFVQGIMVGAVKG
ncbi:MAG: carbohydrate ABC transporter permease [Clostridiales bacterium]|jgi:putative aldouronate transport system permease protein|nr:carbohydrate ABC transporter permease [Clostridiales bacterium]